MTKIDPLAAKVASFKEATKEFREKMAEAVFNAETISEQMARAAAQGLSAIKVDAKGVNMVGTKAAKALIKRLADAGVHCEWVQRTLGDAGTLKYSGLIISWEN